MSKGLRIGPHRRRDAILVHMRRWMDVEGIRETHEQIEQCTVVDCFGNLRIAPAHVAEPLHLLVSNAICMAGKCADKFEQQTFGVCDRCLIEIPGA